MITNNKMKITINSTEKTIELLEEVTFQDLYDYLTTLNCLDYKIKLYQFDNYKGLLDLGEKFYKTPNTNKPYYTITS